MNLITYTSSRTISRKLTIKGHDLEEVYTRVGNTEEWEPDGLPMYDKVVQNNLIFEFSEDNLSDVRQVLDCDLDRAIAAADGMWRITNERM